MKQQLESSVHAPSPMTQAFRVVLHKPFGEWVTHLENMESDGLGSYKSKAPADFYWGHYFQDSYLEAIKDYAQRCQENEVTP